MEQKRTQVVILLVGQWVAPGGGGGGGGTGYTHSAPTAIPVADRCSVQLSPARQRSWEAVIGMHRGCRAATTSPFAEAAIQKMIKTRGRSRDIDSRHVRLWPRWQPCRNRHAKVRCSDM
jgi:hypothetical protein